MCHVLLIQCKAGFWSLSPKNLCKKKKRLGFPTTGIRLVQLCVTGAWGYLGVSGLPVWLEGKSAGDY